MNGKPKGQSHGPPQADQAPPTLTVAAVRRSSVPGNPARAIRRDPYRAHHAAHGFLGQVGEYGYKGPCWQSKKPMQRAAYSGAKSR